MPLNYTSHDNYNMPTSFSYFNWKGLTTRTALTDKTDTDPDIDIINQNSPLNGQTQEQMVDYFKQSDKNPSKKSLNLQLTNHKYGYSDIKTCPTPHSSIEQSSYSVATRWVQCMFFIKKMWKIHLMISKIENWFLATLSSIRMPWNIWWPHRVLVTVYFNWHLHFCRQNYWK